MITEKNKKDILDAVLREESLLGAQNQVANKLGISAATISANIKKPENWHKVADTKWKDIAAALGVSLVSRNWVLVPTKNMKMVHTVFMDAQREGMFMCISDKAGIGKTSSIAAYKEKDGNHSVFSLQCEEWSRRSFLLRLSKELGISVERYDSTEDVIEGIVSFFKRQSGKLPLLILDETDKLKPAAIRLLILLYNRLAGDIGLVICGTENLEKEILRGVRMQEKGYDEIASRFGRRFIKLMGYDHKEVTAICQANGVYDAYAIDQIFNNANPQRHSIDSKSATKVIYDMRLIERGIKAERIRMAHAA